MSEERREDLLVLVADADTRETLDSILSRPQALGIRPIGYHIERHPNRDPGCRTQCVEFLRDFLRTFRFVLVVFDYEGCSSSDPPRRVQERVTEALERNGWKGRARTIVIAPELEIWAWSDLRRLAGALGWDAPSLRRFLEAKGYGIPGQSKPKRPKAAFGAAVVSAPQGTRHAPSARLIGRLASELPFDECRDPAFRELRRTLQAWFPPDASESSAGEPAGSS